MKLKLRYISLLLSTVSIGYIANTFADSPALFFQRDIATCFYCNKDTAVTKGIELGDETRAALKQPATEQPVNIAGLDPKAPEPFKELIKAYEQGDMPSAYGAAKSWVKYQNKIFKRTSDLSALVKKAKLEVDSDSMLDDKVAPEVTIEPGIGSPIKIIFFFNANSPVSETSAREVQAFYRETLALPDIEVVGIPSSDTSIDDLRLFRQSNEISFPLQYNKKLENDLEVESYPSVVAFHDSDLQPCRYEGAINKDKLSDFIILCNAKRLNLASGGPTE